MAIALLRAGAAGSIGTAMQGGIEREIAGLAGRGPGSHELRREAMTRVDRVLKPDGWCTATEGTPAAMPG